MTIDNSENGSTITESGRVPERIWQLHPFKQQQLQAAHIIDGEKEPKLNDQKTADELKLDSQRDVETDKCLQLKTLVMPDEDITGSKRDHELGLALIEAWKTDGILQIALNERQKTICAEAMKANMEFVRKPLEQKKKVGLNRKSE